MSQIETPTDPNQRATTVKNQDFIETNGDCWTKKKKLKALKTVQETGTVAPATLSLTETAKKNNNFNNNNNNNNKNSNKAKKQKLFIRLLRHVAVKTILQRDATTEITEPRDRFPGREDRRDRNRSHEEAIKLSRMKLCRLHPWI